MQTQPRPIKTRTGTSATTTGISGLRRGHRHVTTIPSKHTERQRPQPVAEGPLILVNWVDSVTRGTRTVWTPIEQRFSRRILFPFWRSTLTASGQEHRFALALGPEISSPLSECKRYLIEIAGISAFDPTRKCGFPGSVFGIGSNCARAILLISGMP